MPRLFLTAGTLLALLSGGLSAQVEGLVIDRIPATGVATGPAGEPAITYRIFVDLAPEHILLTAYGDERNPLYLRTSTTFWNDSTCDERFGERIRSSMLKNDHGWFDSWLGFGFGSDQHKAIPHHLDRDGSLLPCPEAVGSGAPIDQRCSSDGLVHADRIPSSVEVNMDLSSVSGSSGSAIATDNGGWAVLGGVRGATPENLVMIAQLTTTGMLEHAINVQVRTPQGEVLRCTSGATTNTEERHVPALRGIARP